MDTYSDSHSAPIVELALPTQQSKSDSLSASKSSSASKSESKAELTPLVSDSSQQSQLARAFVQSEATDPAKDTTLALDMTQIMEMVESHLIINVANFSYSGRNLLQERIDFIDSHSPSQIRAAQVLAYVMGIRGTNLHKLQTKSKDPADLLNRCKELRVTDKKTFVNIATLFPEFAAMSRISNGLGAITPFCKFAGVSKADWIRANQDFVAMTQSDQRGFASAQDAIWDGADTIWSHVPELARCTIRVGIAKGGMFKHGK